MVTAFVRTILLYFIIMLGLRLMGKRQIGELEPTELVLTMLISDLAAVPAARPRSSRTVSFSKPPCGRTASRSTSSSRRCAVRA